MRIADTWTAIVTPFLADGSIDWEGLEKNVEFQISQGVAGLVPAGTTGESPTLAWNEHVEVVDRVLKLCKGRCGVLAGAGSNSTKEAIHSTRQAVNSGAEAVLIVDCYYNGPSSQELRDEYYAIIAAEFPGVTIVPYIIPGRTGTSLSVEDLAILADRYPGIDTVKEATGDIERMAKTRALLGNEFSIMSGDDDMTYAMMADPRVKADGVISVDTNVVPGPIANMVSLAASGDLSGAEKLKDALAPLLGTVTVKVDNPRTLPNGQTVMVNDRYRNPLAIKTLMQGLGMPCGACRRPLGKMTAAGVSVVRSAVKQVWANNPELLTPIGTFYNLDIEARIEDDAVWSSLAL